MFNVMVSRSPVVSINFENYVIDMIDNSTDSKWPCLLSAFGKLKLNSKKGVQEGEMVVPKECLKLCDFARKFKCPDCLQVFTKSRPNHSCKMHVSQYRWPKIGS